MRSNLRLPFVARLGLAIGLGLGLGSGRGLGRRARPHWFPAGGFHHRLRTTVPLLLLVKDRCNNSFCHENITVGCGRPCIAVSAPGEDSHGRFAARAVFYREMRSVLRLPFPAKMAARVATRSLHFHPRVLAALHLPLLVKTTAIVAVVKTPRSASDDFAASVSPRTVASRGTLPTDSVNLRDLVPRKDATI